MERDSKRNSILKAVCVTYSTVSFEEESREVYRLQQRSLKKRVSFAGRDEIKEFKKTEPLLHQPSVEIIANNLLCDNENSYGDMLLKSESPEFCSDNLQDIPYVIPSKTISFSEVKEVREEVFTASIPCVTVTEPKIGLQVPEEEKNQDIVMAGLASSSVLNDLLSLHSAVWKLSFVAQRMTLICESRFLRLSFKLGNHFDYDYEKHFKIGDMDVDVAQAESTAKWVRFGCALLENTLENTFKKLPDPSTLDLKGFLQEAERIYRSFSEFLSIDVIGIELLADPRSLRLDTELYKISFDMSNLENLQMIHADLLLRGVYPLSFSEVKLANKIGSINIKEATTMLMNTRSSSSFLTKVAQCLSDLLKFKPCI